MVKMVLDEYVYVLLICGWTQVLNYLFICAGFNLLLCAGVMYSRSTDLGVFWSHLTAQLLKTNGMVVSVCSGNFQWYFMGTEIFR